MCSYPIFTLILVVLCFNANLAAENSKDKVNAGKTIAGYDISGSIAEMINKMADGKDDIFVLQGNFKSSYTIGWIIGILLSLILSIVVYIIMICYCCGWCCTQLCSACICKKNKDNPTNKGCCKLKKKETSPICKYGTLIAFIILTAVLLLHIGILIYGSFIVIKPIDKIKGSLNKLNNMLNDIIDFTQDSIESVDPGIDHFKDIDDTRSLIRPVLVTLYYFQDILNNDQETTAMYNGLNTLGDEQGNLMMTNLGMQFGYAALEMIDDYRQSDKIFLDKFEDNFNQVLQQIRNQKQLDNINKIISDSQQLITCIDVFNSSQCPQIYQPNEQKTQIDWISEAIKDLNMAYDQETNISVIQDAANEVSGDAAEKVEILDEDNYTRSCTFDDFINYVEVDAIEFESYAKLMSISTQMARDTIDVVNANLEDARETIISQTGNAGFQIVENKDIIYNKLISLYEKYVEQSSFNYMKLIKTIAAIFGVLLILWFIWMILQVAVIFFFPKSRTIGCCICSEFTMLIVCGLYFLVFSIVACLMSEFQKFIYEDFPSRFLTGEKMLQIVSESFSCLDMSKEYVSQVLKYYYGPTQDTDQNPMEKLLKQFVDSGLSQSDMVKEVLPKQNNSHSIIIQDIYSYSDYIDEYPNATIQPMIAYNEPFYCDPTEAPDIIGSKPGDTEARICWNVLGDVIQQQMDRNKTALWNKFDGFVDEIVVYENSGY
ncbi:MAG: hypothetical protein EZS28_021224 [Streblomastix strix]|uniref:Uncharacterized protein n=1 Tax=Streblomastix strix TaxID=222440 RepID=A0A5J4VLM1_9EUKA|nr:MAG: hypothetical protein EZS28_021224 [Streblomastix strix]